MKIKNYILKFVFIIAFMLIIMPSDVYADAKKTIKVPLKSSYDSCTFHLTFKKGAEYNVKLISPDGEEYVFDTIDDTTMRCVCADVEEGTWKIKISTTELDSIGKVSVSVNASKPDDRDINSDIRVGRDIQGLTNYFVDDTVCVDWTDDTCGNINIRVLNLDNNELIANETVNNEEKHFEQELPDGIKRLSVSVVPSTSAGIDGAEKTFTLEVNNHPDAYVIFPDNYFINTQNLTAKMILNQSYGYEIYDNGKLTDKSESLDAGTYEVQIPLDGDGEHDVLIYIVDSDGNKRSTSGSFNRDTVPPYVALDKEYDGMSVGESEYTISGSIKDYDKLIINEDEVKPSSDGHFEYTCKLHEGDNKISITATDAAENITSGEVVLTYNKKESSNNHVSTMIAVVVLLVLIKLLFSRKKKNRKNPRSKKQKRNSKEPPMRPDTEKSGEDADDEEEDEEEEEDVIL